MEQYEIQPRKLLSRVGLGLFFMAVATLISSVLIQLVVETYFKDILDTDWFLWAATAITVVGIGLPVFYLATKKIPNSEHKEIVKLRSSEFIIFFFICVATMYITSYFGTFIGFLVSMIKGEEIYNPLIDAVLDSNIFITFFYGAIAAPIVEELIFRKFLLNKVRRFGDLPAILLTGFAFGLYHMNLSQFFYATALGFLFAYITLKTNTVRYSILLHMIINGIGTTIAPMLVRNENMLLIMIMGIWVLSSITIGCVFFVLNVKKIKFEKAEVPVEKKSVFFFNTGTILFTLVCLIITVLML